MTGKGARQAVLYVACGLGSTAVSWACVAVANRALFGGVLHPSAAQNVALGSVSWLSGMLAAFFLTRRFVFRTQDPVMGELARHVKARIGTLFIEQALRQLLARAGADVFLATFLVTALSTALNYVLAKRFVFHEKK